MEVWQSLRGKCRLQLFGNSGVQQGFSSMAPLEKGPIEMDASKSYGLNVINKAKDLMKHVINRASGLQWSWLFFRSTNPAPSAGSSHFQQNSRCTSIYLFLSVTHQQPGKWKSAQFMVRLMVHPLVVASILKTFAKKKRDSHFSRTETSNAMLVLRSLTGYQPQRGESWSQQTACK